jgi:hypothetical protein
MNSKKEKRRCPHCGRDLPTEMFQGKNSGCNDCHRYGSPEAARRAARARERKAEERRNRGKGRRGKWSPPTGKELERLRDDWSECT